MSIYIYKELPVEQLKKISATAEQISILGFGTIEVGFIQQCIMKGENILNDTQNLLSEFYGIQEKVASLPAVFQSQECHRTSQDLLRLYLVLFAHKNIMIQQVDKTFQMIDSYADNELKLLKETYQDLKSTYEAKQYRLPSNEWAELQKYIENLDNYIQEIDQCIPSAKKIINQVRSIQRTELIPLTQKFKGYADIPFDQDDVHIQTILRNQIDEFLVLLDYQQKKYKMLAIVTGLSSVPFVIGLAWLLAQHSMFGSTMSLLCMTCPFLLYAILLLMFNVYGQGKAIVMHTLVTANLGILTAAILIYGDISVNMNLGLLSLVLAPISLAYIHYVLRRYSQYQGIKDTLQKISDKTADLYVLAAQAIRQEKSFLTKIN